MHSINRWSSRVLPSLLPVLTKTHLSSYEMVFWHWELLARLTKTHLGTYAMVICHWELLARLTKTNLSTYAMVISHWYLLASITKTHLSTYGVVISHWESLMVAASATLMSKKHPRVLDQSVASRMRSAHFTLIVSTCHANLEDRCLADDNL